MLILWSANKLTQDVVVMKVRLSKIRPSEKIIFYPSEQGLMQRALAIIFNKKKKLLLSYCCNIVVI